MLPRITQQLPADSTSQQQQTYAATPNKPSPSDTPASAIATSTTSPTTTTAAPQFDLVGFLHAHPMFNQSGVELDAAFIDTLTSHMNVRHLQPGDLICREGEIGRAMFFLLRGSVTVASKDGESVYAELGAGSLFGEIGVVMDVPRTANVVAKTRVVVAALRRENFSQIVQHYPIIAKSIKEQAERRYQQLLLHSTKGRPKGNDMSPQLPRSGAIPSRRSETQMTAEQISPADSSLDQTATPKKTNARLGRTHTFPAAAGSELPLPAGVDNFLDAYDKTTSDMRSRASLMSLNSTEAHHGSNGSTQMSLRNLSGDATHSLSGSAVNLSVLVGSITERTLAASASPLSPSAGSSSTTSTSSPLSAFSNANYVLTGITAAEETTGFGSQQIYTSRQTAAPLTMSDNNGTKSLRKASSSSVLLSAEFDAASGNYKQKRANSRDGNIIGSAPSIADSESNLNGSGRISKTIAESSVQSKSHSAVDSISAAASKASSGETAAITPRRTSRPTSEIAERQPIDEESEGEDEDEVTVDLAEASNNLIVKLETEPETDENDDEDEEEDEDESVMELRAPMHAPPRQVNMHNPALLGLMGPNKRRASIAVWSDSRLTEMANQKAGIAPSASQPRFGATVLKSADDLCDSESDITDDDDEQLLHPLKDPRLIPMFIGALPFQQVWRLRAVCRVWRQAIENSPKLVRHIDLSAAHKKLDDVSLTQLLNAVSASNIERLILKSCWRVTNRGLLTVAARASALIVLDISGCWDVTDDAVAAVASRCPSLRSIDLSNCRKVTDHAILALASQCTQLREILLSYCKQLTDASVAYFANYGTNLRRINLQRCLGITDQAYRTFSSVMASARHLKLQELILSDCSFLTDSAIQDIAESCPNLRTLNVSFCCALTDSSFTQALIPNCGRIRVLDASFCGSAISDDVVSAMASAWPDLERLSTRGCVRLTDGGVRALIQHGANMKQLNVSSCRNVTDACLRSVPSHWRLLNAQTPVVENNGVGGTDDIYGSTHIRRFTSP